MIKLDNKEISGCQRLLLGMGRVEGEMNGKRTLKLLCWILQWPANALITLSKLMGYKIQTVMSTMNFS